MTTTDTQQGETLEPTLEELAEQAASLLLNLSGGADTQLRRAKQIAFALRANIANARRAAVAGPRGDALLSAMWAALKDECCKVPAEAQQIVFLGEEKFRKALTPFAAPADNDAESLLQHVAYSGVEFDDNRMGYVVVQIDRDVWEQIKKLAPATTKGDRRCH